jgi:hypothetical protein
MLEQCWYTYPKRKLYVEPGDVRDYRRNLGEGPSNCRHGLFLPVVRRDPFVMGEFRAQDQRGTEDINVNVKESRIVPLPAARCLSANQCSTKPGCFGCCSAHWIIDARCGLK